MKVYNLEIPDLSTLGIGSSIPVRHESAMQYLAKLYQHNEQNDKLYLHCHLGKGRTSMLLIGLLCYQNFQQYSFLDESKKVQWIKDNIVIPCREISPGMIHTADQLYEAVIDINEYLIKLHDINHEPVSSIRLA